MLMDLDFMKDFKWRAPVRAFAFALFCATVVMTKPAPAEPLEVVVTIKPLHSLVSSLLLGVAEPQLLLEGGASPHAYALRPSDAMRLSRARIVVRASRYLEVFVAKALEVLPSRPAVVDADAAPGLLLLPVRHESEIPSPMPKEGDGYDPHFWMDPLNAGAIASYLATIFEEAEPGSAAAIAANLTSLKGRLAALDRDIRGALAGVEGIPFIVFHDTTQYLEKRYHLRALFAVSLNPERPPGAKRIIEIRQRMIEAHTACVMTEPQFAPKLVRTLVEGIGAREGEIDEIGADVPPGPDHYFDLMQKTARSLARCLRG